jgi:methylmalonyl-CoA/ethylmalonyl-CoA epimerase
VGTSRISDVDTGVVAAVEPKDGAGLAPGLHLSFHHFGLATSRPADATALLRSLGYAIGPTVHDPLQKVDLILCTSTTMPAVEIVFGDDPDAPIARFLRVSSGLFYHQCFATPDLPASLAGLKRAGHRLACVAPRKPAVLFGGRMVSFYFIPGYGLIELLEGTP